MAPSIHRVTVGGSRGGRGVRGGGYQAPQRRTDLPSGSAPHHFPGENVQAIMAMVPMNSAVHALSTIFQTPACFLGSWVTAPTTQTAHVVGSRRGGVRVIGRVDTIRTGHGPPDWSSAAALTSESRQAHRPQRVEQRLPVHDLERHRSFGVVYLELSHTEMELIKRVLAADRLARRL